MEIFLLWCSLAFNFHHSITHYKLKCWYGDSPLVNGRNFVYFFPINPIKMRLFCVEFSCMYFMFALFYNKFEGFLGENVCIVTFLF